MAADVRDTEPVGMWRRSSHCTPGKNCVEIRSISAGMIIRDSKSRAALRAVAAAPWAALVMHCRSMD